MLKPPLPQIRASTEALALSEKLIEMVPTSPDRFCDHRALLETSLARLYRLGFFLRDVGGWQAKYSERN